MIAAIGFATNIADLLRSGADDHSPLSGGFQWDDRVVKVFDYR